MGTVRHVQWFWKKQQPKLKNLLLLKRQVVL